MPRPGLPGCCDRAMTQLVSGSVEVTAEVSAGPLMVEVAGEGAGEVPLDATHLVVTSMSAAFEAMDVSPPSVRLSCRNRIPQARGLGSSSAAIVGGIGLARALVIDGDARLSNDAAFRLAAELEGHPDNVAAAHYGGFVVTGREGGEWYAARVAVDAGICAVAFVPPTPVGTAAARRLLPSSVPHCDAAANAGRTALLVAALGGQPQHLMAATRDFLHQDYREPAMPETLGLVRLLRANGVPTVVSGAGPSALALCARPDQQHALLDQCPRGWQAYPLAIESDGCRREP
jgi:homoserine kinase